MARGGPSAAASPPTATAGGGRTARGPAEEEPACGAALNGSAAAAPRRARARAVGTVNRRGRYGSPVPTSAPRRIAPATRLRLRADRTRPAGVRQNPCSAGGGPAGIGTWPGDPWAWARRVQAPPGSTTRRRRQPARRTAGTAAASRGVRAGAGDGLPGEETAALQVDRKRRRGPVHAVPSVIRSEVADRGPAARGEVRAPGRILVHLVDCGTNTSASCAARHRSAD
jgi:hypothetical protein